MASFVLSRCRRLLVTLPAIVVFVVVIFVQGKTHGQGAPREPYILISADALAFVAAMQPEFPAIDGLTTADIVILYPAPPSGAHLVLVDVKAKRKFWTTLPLHKLRRILGRIGDPA